MFVPDGIADLMQVDVVTFDDFFLAGCVLGNFPRDQFFCTVEPMLVELAITIKTKNF